MFRKADERHARAFQTDGRAINEKVRLYARVGAALIAARDNKQDPFDAITAVIPWDRFLATVAQAEALARSEEFDASRCSASTMPASAVGLRLSLMRSSSRVCRPRRRSCSAIDGCAK